MQHSIVTSVHGNVNVVSSNNLMQVAALNKIIRVEICEHYEALNAGMLLLVVADI